jgi:hypothetical protein
VARGAKADRFGTLCEISQRAELAIQFDHVPIANLGGFPCGRPSLLICVPYIATITGDQQWDGQYRNDDDEYPGYHLALNRVLIDSISIGSRGSVSESKKSKNQPDHDHHANSPENVVHSFPPVETAHIECAHHFLSYEFHIGFAVQMRTRAHGAAGI